MDKAQFTAEELAALEASALKTHFGGATELPEGYAQRMGEKIAVMLTKSPYLYLCFGVYWWAVKQALIEIKQEGWWTESPFDDAMWGVLPTAGAARDLLRAMIYAEYNHWQASHDHTWLTRSGAQQPYYLIDVGAGV